MTTVVLIDPREGVTKEQVQSMLDQGFKPYPKVSISTGAPTIATPNSPQGMGNTAIVDMWIGPEDPMIPQAYVAATIVRAAEQGEPLMKTLNQLSLAFFACSLQELGKRVRFSSAPADSDEPNERTDGEMGEDGGTTEIQVVNLSSRKK